MATAIDARTDSRPTAVRLDAIQTIEMRTIEPAESVPPMFLASASIFPIDGPVTPPMTGSVTRVRPSGTTRRVRLVVFPPRVSKIAIDGVSYHPSSELDLTAGAHRVQAEGLNGCCESYDKTVTVPVGKDLWSAVVTLTLKPAIIHSAPDRLGVLIVVRRADGSEVARGKAPLAVYFGTETHFSHAHITVESGSSGSKQFVMSLTPGDPFFIDF